MNTTTIQLQESVANPSLAKVDELRFTLRASSNGFPSGSIRWKANSTTVFTARIVTVNSESTQTETVYQNGWSSMTFVNQDCEVFVSPKSKISEFQLLTDDVSENVILDWTTLVYSGVRKLLTNKASIDASILPLLTNITSWDSIKCEQEIDFDLFTKMESLTYLSLHGSAVRGNLKSVGALTHLQSLFLKNTINMQCQLSDIAGCSSLQTIGCTGSSNVQGALEDLLPLSNTLTSVQLNGSVNVYGTLDSLRQLHYVTNCKLGMTGVTGKITDLNGMISNGTLSLKVSEYIENDFNSVVFVNEGTYQITFDSNGEVSNVSIV